MPEGSAGERVRELHGFALDRLPAMRLADGAFCHEVVAPGLEPRGRSLRYTLISLLGLQRARAAGLEVTVDPGELYELAVDEIDAPEITIGDLGLLLWADAPSGEQVARQGRLPPARQDRRQPAGPRGPRAELGRDRRGRGRRRHPAGRRARSDSSRASSPRAGCSATSDAGRRARFPNFATQIYGVLALAIAARHGREAALAPARRAADRLLELQRQDGGWPWIFDARKRPGRRALRGLLGPPGRDGADGAARAERGRPGMSATPEPRCAGSAGSSATTSSAARCSTGTPGSSTARSAAVAASTAPCSTRTPPGRSPDVRRSRACAGPGGKPDRPSLPPRLGARGVGGPRARR